MTPPIPDPAAARLAADTAALGAALATWAGRDDSRPQAGVRRAANDAIDAMISELYSLRGRLAGQIRVSDDLAAERADAMLARLRDRRAER
jgi:hypothetical protein